MNGKSFATRLKQARERSGISQKRLGEKIGLDPTVASTRINRYEQQTRQPHVDTVAKIAKVLAVSPSYFYEPNDTIASFIYVLSGMDEDKLEDAMAMLMKFDGADNETT